MSKVQVDTIDTRSGTSTMQIGSTNTSTINIGVSGDTVNIPSGVTIANAGTATGFGDNTPSFFVFRSGNQNISDATTTKVEFNSEVFDTDNAFDSSTNYRFTVPSGEAGKYHFSYSVSCHALSASELEIADVYFYKNGSAVNEQSLDFRNNPVRRFCVTNSIILNLSVGDYVEVYGKIDDSSSTPKFDGESTYTTYFQGFKLL